MRKILIKWLTVACALLLTVASLAVSGACAIQTFELYGLEPKEEIIVTQGDFVTLENFHVFDNEDNYYEVQTKVVDAAGNEVAIVSKGFFASKAMDYTIIYTVISVDGIYVEKTLVRVQENAEIKAINALVPETAEVGSPVSIVIDTADRENYSYAITVTFDGVTEAVEDQTFTPTQVGEHTVTITATAEGLATIEENFSVNVLPATIEGTVETFDENWKNKRGDWYVTDTQETGLKNRFGDDGSYITVETSEQWLRFYIKPLKEKSYYEQLAADGYEYVSVWVYLDSRLGHVVQHFNGYSNYYAKSNNLQPKQWQEIRITLQDDPKMDFEGSFLNGFSYFASGKQQLLTFDNSDEYNGSNGGRERDENGDFSSYRVYIDDIYAVKKGAAIELDEALQPEIVTGEEYDLTQFVTGDNAESLQYKLSYRGKTYTAEEGRFTFTESGEYTLSVGYATQNPNLYGSKKMSFTVSSPYTAEYQSVIEEKTGSSVDVDLTKLGVALKTQTGTAVDNVTFQYSATKNGKAATVTGSVLTATEIGSYDVEVKVAYSHNGVQCVTYVDAVIDVWDTENKYNVFTFDGSTEYFADSFYMNKSWETKPKTEVLESFDGETEVLKVAMPSQQRGLVSAKPTYSKNYYEQMLVNDDSVQNFGQLFVSFSYQIVDETGSNKTRKAWVLHAPTATTVTCGQWYTVSMTLEDFVNNYYDVMKGGFEYLNQYRGGESITIGENKGYAFFALQNNNQLKTTCYLTECTVFVQEFTGKYVDITQSDRIFSWDYNWQRLTYDKVFKVETFTEETAIGGKTGEMLVYSGSQQKMGFQYIPPCAKDYYEFILSKYANAYVSVYVYADIPAMADYTNVRLTGLGGSAQDSHIRKWHEVKIMLSDIIANFDALQISTLKDSNRKSLISIENIHYTKNEANKPIKIYFSGFNFVLGEATAN